MGTYLPPSWPPEVEAPEAVGFRRSALAWLWTLVPRGYHDHQVLRDYPSVIVVLARHLLVARFKSARACYRTAATQLAEHMPPHQVNEVRAVCKAEGAWLAAAAAALDLVDRAMRGEVFTPESAAPAPWFPPPWLQITPDD